jgi:hypothetical protein
MAKMKTMNGHGHDVLRQRHRRRQVAKVLGEHKSYFVAGKDSAGVVIGYFPAAAGGVQTSDRPQGSVACGAPAADYESASASGQSAGK